MARDNLAPTQRYGCPLDAVGFNLPVTNGTPIPTTTPTRRQSGDSTPGDVALFGSNWTRATGTKLPNAIRAVRNGTYNAWSTANGGRNNAAGEGTARKVLVLMTDGFNEINSEVGAPWNSAGTSRPDPDDLTAAWTTEVTTLAADLKNGLTDNDPATLDDNVEIFVVGFFCTPQGAYSWCASRLADTPPPHPCPGPAFPPTGLSPAPTEAQLRVDRLLNEISSSSPGTCDRYFPISKAESLPELFRVLAGSVARSRLQ